MTTTKHDHLRGSQFGIDDPHTLADIQGNILVGYRARFVRHLVVRVRNPLSARAFIEAVVSGRDDVPQLTTAERWYAKPSTCLNVAVTYTGLQALGLDDRSLQTFPLAFQQGAAARAHKVGDVGDSAPDGWRDGLGDPDAAHLMWTIHAFADRADIESLALRLESMWILTQAFSITSRFDGATFDTYPGHAESEGATVHFGYRDSISQPRFQLPGHEVAGRADSQPLAPVGSVLLGSEYATSFPDERWQMPEAFGGSEVFDLGSNGCYNAFRVLGQDVVGFETFLQEAADRINVELDDRYPGRDPAIAPPGDARYQWDKERVAAKLMGRWRNGMPLSQSHWTNTGAITAFPGPGMPPLIADEQLNNFDYPDTNDSFDDSNGTRCPLGAHIRRGNPRGSRIVERSANYTRPIVRRGMPYGPPYDPSAPQSATGVQAEERGLIGSFLCASLVAQFEAIMNDWIHLGLQDPRITGTNDPVIGANTPRESRFEIPLAGFSTSTGAPPPLVVTGFPSFTTTRASLYLFCPSVRALRFLAGLSPGATVARENGQAASTSAVNSQAGNRVIPTVAASRSANSHGHPKDPKPNGRKWKRRRAFWNKLAIVKYKGQKATVVKAPTEPSDTVTLVPFVTRHPKIPIDRIVVAERLPAEEVDRAKQAFTRLQHRLVLWYSPMVKGLPSVPEDGEEALAGAYTRAHRACFPAPVRAPEARDLGALAVASPYASYLAATGEGTYRWDLRDLARFEVQRGLQPLGAVVDFSLDTGTGRLSAARIESALGVAHPGAPGWHEAMGMAVCTVTTHASLIRHFNWLHLTAGPILEAVTRNHLPAAHPVRRLLWMHVFGTHAGNELVTEILLSKRGEFDSIFAFSHRGKCELFESSVGQFDLAAINPRTDAERRGVTALASPALDNWTALYDLYLAHAHRYLAVYYPSDDAAVADQRLGGWIEELDRRLPGGVRGAMGPKADLDGVATLLATVMYLATVEHEITGSGLWDYQLWPDTSPVRVYKDGRRAPLDVYQRLVNANFNLNVRRTMLLDDQMPLLAVDARGASAFVQFQQDLLALQAALDRTAGSPWRIEPRRLKANINA